MPNRTLTPPLALLFIGLLAGSVVADAQQQTSPSFAEYRACMSQAVSQRETEFIAAEEELARTTIAAMRERLSAYQRAWQLEDEIATNQAFRDIDTQYRDHIRTAQSARTDRIRQANRTYGEARRDCQNMRREREREDRQRQLCGNGRCDSNEREQCPQDCGSPTPSAPTPTTPVTPSTFCGNSRCEVGEQSSCPRDCRTEPLQPVCGDGQCAGIEHISCPRDCQQAGSVCGDGRCEQNERLSCAADCGGSVCGNKRCEGNEAQTCAQDCPQTRQVCSTYVRDGIRTEHCATCGNGICEAFEECTASVCTNGVCTRDCGRLHCQHDCQQQRTPICGDGLCEGNETQTCRRDCGAVCGDNRCEGDELQTCRSDCERPPNRCGDGICAPEENAVFCPFCSQGTPPDQCVCQSICPQDCGNP